MINVLLRAPTSLNLGSLEGSYYGPSPLLVNPRAETVRALSDIQILANEPVRAQFNPKILGYGPRRS